MRRTRDELAMAQAWLMSEQGTCPTLQVGCVFTREGRTLVSGYNGAPAGLPHCSHQVWGNSDPGRVTCTSAEHAERNAIAWAARHGIPLLGSTCAVTHMPCLPCAMSLINAGVDRVIYQESYRIVAGVQLLQQAGIVVDQLIVKG